MQRKIYTEKGSKCADACEQGNYSAGWKAVCYFETVYVNVSFGQDMDMSAILNLKPEYTKTMLEENLYLRGMYLRGTIHWEALIGREKRYINVAVQTAQIPIRKKDNR